MTKVNTYLFCALFLVGITLFLPANVAKFSVVSTVMAAAEPTSPQLEGFGLIMQLLSSVLGGASNGGNTTPTVTPPGGLSPTPTLPPLNPSGTIEECTIHNDLPSRVQCIIGQIIEHCPPHAAVPGGPPETSCLNTVAALSPATKSFMIANANIMNNGQPIGLQCVGLAYGLVKEFYGTTPVIGGNNQVACQKWQGTDDYEAIPYSSQPPLPGDLVIWRDKDQPCDNDHAGHIAYVVYAPDLSYVVVAEANADKFIRNTVQIGRKVDQRPGPEAYGQYTVGYLRHR